jgi:hypothetical protein
MKLKGVLNQIYETVQVTKDFQRRNIVLEVNNTGHAEHISLEFHQDHCKLVDSFEKGAYVIVDFNIKGRKWINPEGVEKYFNTLQAWRIVLNPDKDD